MENKIKTYIRELENDIISLKRSIDSMDYNRVMVIIGEKERVIERLNKIISK